MTDLQPTENFGRLLPIKPIQDCAEPCMMILGSIGRSFSQEIVRQPIRNQARGRIADRLQREKPAAEFGP